MVARWRGGEGRAAGIGVLGREPPGGAAPRKTPAGSDATPRATVGGATSRPAQAATLDPLAKLNSSAPGIVSRRSSSRARQASRNPPSAYRIRSSAARPGGAKRSRATRTSVRCPTTSLPSRIHPRRLSSSLSAATWLRAPARAAGKLGDSRTSS